jgi:lysophospholipase
VSQAFRILTAITPDKIHLRAGVWEVPEGVKARGICVLLHGMSEFLEKYGEVAGELGHRGFIVASFDWRSQGASERRRAGNRASHVGTFEEYDRDLAAMLLQIVEPMQRIAPLPVFGLAHSMGGQILLRFLHEHPRRFTCAVLVAPMLEIETGKYSPQVTKTVALAFNLRRPSTRLLFGTEERDPLDVGFEGNVLTSDRARFERTRGLLKQQPFLRVHGPTFGWLGAAFRSIAHVRRRGFAEDIVTPTLVFGSGRDRVVKTSVTRDYVKRMAHARYVEIDEAEHEILMEKDSIRAHFWSEFDAFIDAQLATAVPFAPQPRAPVEVKPIRGFSGKEK